MSLIQVTDLTFSYPSSYDEIFSHASFQIDTRCPQAQPWQIAREISLLDVEEAALERPFSSLSQGEQTKLLLSALFLKEGHFLLIDEPTNHLNEEGRRKVAA